MYRIPLSVSVEDLCGSGQCESLEVVGPDLTMAGKQSHTLGRRYVRAEQLPAPVYYDF